MQTMPAAAPATGQGPPPETVDVLGCHVHGMTLAGAADLAEEFIREGEPRRFVVVNAAKLVNMRSHAPLRDSVLTADLVGADGVSIVWAARLLGTPLPGRVNGTDLMMELLGRSNAKGYRVFFLGARPEVLRSVLDVVRRQFPGVEIAGAHHGLFDATEHEAILDQIRDARADILFIALPTPAKELWAMNYLDRMDVSIVHGVGGSFDVLAGVVRRAPGWMQRCGLEWLFRLAQEPRRLWRRYLVTNTVFLALMARELVTTRLPSHRTSA